MPNGPSQNPYTEQIEQIEKINNPRNRILQEFRELIKPNYGFDFDIRTGELEVDNIGGFSDGTYKLDNYNFQEIDKEQNIYSLECDFKIKKKGLEYRKTINLTFHYINGNEMIINYKEKFFRIPIRNKIQYIKKRNKHHIQTEVIGKRKIINIKDLKLLIEFKTD